MILIATVDTDIVSQTALAFCLASFTHISFRGRGLFTLIDQYEGSHLSVGIFHECSWLAMQEEDDPYS